MTPSQKTSADLTALLRARNTFFWIVTREEVRVERAITEAAGAAKFETLFWDCATGLTTATGANENANLRQPDMMLDRIRDDKRRVVYVLRDFHRWFDPMTLRSLRSLARNLQQSPRAEARAVIVLTPSSEVPPELAGHATVIDYPLPARPEIAEILDSVIAALPEDIRVSAAPTNGARDQAIDAAVGLTAEEAANCYAKSLVTTKTIDPAQIASEKRRVIAREKVLTWYDPEPRGLDAVGGLEFLKEWLVSRRAAFSQRARDFGLPTPKGSLFLGVPGCGKSLMAKAIAAAWGMPLLRLDLGALRSKYVGESEGNIRKALAVAGTVAPCVLWIDEIEKELAGSTGEQGDGGVAADALGAVLSWMQERTEPVFVVATANKVTGLPPELLRKGRFDEIFFVDLPTPREREQVLSATLTQYCSRMPIQIDLTLVASETKGFTGAEIAAIVPDALFLAFADGERPITTADLIASAKNVVPLSETASEQILALRQWAKGRARFASKPVAESPRKPRELDI
jgi:SpoVK/Ycf46/Vps4 family AAA+-type ATPase